MVRARNISTIALPIGSSELAVTARASNASNNGREHSHMKPIVRLAHVLQLLDAHKTRFLVWRSKVSGGSFRRNAVALSIQIEFTKIGARCRRSETPHICKPQVRLGR